MTSQPIDVDLFAGGGGASEGKRRATGRSPDIAVNHLRLCGDDDTGAAWSALIKMNLTRLADAVDAEQAMEGAA